MANDSNVKIVVETIDKTTDAVKNVNLGWVNMAAALNIAKVAFGALQGAAVQAYAVINEGAQIQATATTFDNLVLAVGDADAAIIAMTESTGGMVSETDLLTNANRFLSLGVAGNITDLAELAEIGSQLGTAFGVGAAGGMEQLALIIANQSTPRLDSLGISADAVKNRIAELTEAGMDAGEAFTLATLEQGRIALANVGDQSVTTAGQLAQLEATTLNMNNMFKVAVAEGATPLVEAMLALSEATGESELSLDGLVTGIVEKALEPFTQAIEAVTAWTTAFINFKQYGADPVLNTVLFVIEAIKEMNALMNGGGTGAAAVGQFGSGLLDDLLPPTTPQEPPPPSGPYEPPDGPGGPQQPRAPRGTTNFNFFGGNTASAGAIAAAVAPRG